MGEIKIASLMTVVALSRNEYMNNAREAMTAIVV